MDSYKEDMAELRAEFARVNTSDPKALKSWFDNTPHLNASDRMVIAGVSRFTINKWNRMVGIKPNAKFVPPKYVRRRPVCTLNVPEDWDNPEWLTHAYSVTGSVDAIAEAIGVKRDVIKRRFKRYRIQSNNDSKRPHECRNRRWLVDHYVKKRMSQKKCSELAKVSRSTLLGWLVEFKIPVRGIQEERGAGVGVKNPHVCLWGRKLHSQLNRHPAVRKAYLYDSGIVARYRSHVKEVYWFGEARTRKRAFGVDKWSAAIVNPPKVYEQFPEPFGPTKYPAHLIIERAAWRKATLMEQRVALHSMHLALRAERWERPLYPPYELELDIARLRSYRRGRHVYKGGFIGFRRSAGPGWPTVLQYFDMQDSIGRVWAHPKKLYYAMAYLAKKDRGLNTTTIIIMAALRHKIRVPPPTLWADILLSVSPTGTVLDLYPGLGSRAIACSILGLKYRTAPDEKLEAAMARGLQKHLELDWAPDDGSPVDVVIADNCNGPVDIQAALSHAGRARRIVCYVPRADLEAVSALKPSAILRVRKRLYVAGYDYLAVW